MFYCNNDNVNTSVNWCWRNIVTALPDCNENHFFFFTAYPIWLGQWKVPQHHLHTQKDQFRKENIMNRFSNAQKIFCLCLGMIICTWWKVRIATSLAKQFPAKPAPSVSNSPCNTFMFAQWIYQMERKEVPFHAKCDFFWHNNMNFLKSLRMLRKTPIRRSWERKKKVILITFWSTVNSALKINIQCLI